MEPLDLRLIVALERLSMAMRGDLARRGREHDLSPLQAQILSYLLALPEPPGVRDLARLLGLSPGTVSETVSSLERQGLLEKVPHPRNRRKVLLQLTEKGNGIAQDLAAWVHPLRESLARLPVETKAQTLWTLQEVMLALFREGRIPHVRMCLSCAYFDPSQRYCTFLNEPLRPEDLRVDCPDHRLREDLIPSR